MLFQPLFADIADVIGVLVTIAIIGFSVISKIISSMNEGDAQQQRPAARPQQGQGGAGGGAARSVEAEIEEFLRQARGGGQQQPAPRQPAQAKVPRQPAARVKPRVIEAVPVEDDIVPGASFARDLSEHVAEHIERDSISRRNAHLGEVVEASDERIEHHLEAVFDHDIGKLAHSEKVDTSIAEGTDAQSWEEKTETQLRPAEKIAAMLKSPESVRDLFVASEILKRPEI